MACPKEELRRSGYIQLQSKSIAWWPHSVCWNHSQSEPCQVCLVFHLYSLDWKRLYFSVSHIKYDLLFNSHLRNSSTKCRFLAGKEQWHWNTNVETWTSKHEQWHWACGRRKRAILETKLLKSVPFKGTSNEADRCLIAICLFTVDATETNAC